MEGNPAKTSLGYIMINHEEEVKNRRRILNIGLKCYKSGLDWTRLRY